MRSGSETSTEKAIRRKRRIDDLVKQLEKDPPTSKTYVVLCHLQNVGEISRHALKYYNHFFKDNIDLEHCLHGLRAQGYKINYINKDKRGYWSLDERDTEWDILRRPLTSRKIDINQLP